MLLYLDLEDYLAQWFIHDMGGEYPVFLKRGTIEYGMLETFLTTPPDHYEPPMGDGMVPIELPNFRSKDTRYNYFLPKRATEALKACIRTRFDMCLWNEIHKFSNMFLRQDELIYAFMEKYGIEMTETNWNTIAKRYQRKRDIYRRVMSRKKKKEGKSTSSEHFSEKPE